MNGPAVRIVPYGLAFFSSLCIMVLELVASRLVARHVGASLTVWTSVIGVMLGGICLGNVLGGRLADRVDPRRAVGPLYATGAALTLLCLWVNSVAGLVPDVESLPWLRALVIVALDFLVPTTVLGMISPVVAKMAVEEASARGTGLAVGLVYFLGSVGSIVGTFVAGFYLMYAAANTEIVQVVAAGLLLMAAVLLRGPLPKVVALMATAALLLGSIGPLARTPADLGQQHYASFVARLSISAVVGNALALAAAVSGFLQLRAARVDAARAEAADPALLGDGERPRLGDLSALSFVASMAFMALEMDAGRMVQRHLGSSIYGWTSIIGVLLGGLSLGNFAGGLIANRVRRETQASWLFLVASLLTLSVLLLESPPKRLVWNPYGHFVRGEAGEMVLGSTTPVLSRAIGMAGYAWSSRILLVVTAVFLLPSIALGTVSPVVAKLAVDRVRASKRTGAAIGQVYAWGMVGSLVGTFLTGFVLIDTLGTKGVILVLGVTLAFAATYLGSIWHAAWAGIPLGLCIIAFYPAPFFRKQGLDWGIREESGRPEADGEDELAYVDESDYYYIKVSNEPDAEGKKRTLVLDNLIHGYFILGHPERLDYDYEHIYALVADRVARAKAQAGGTIPAPPPPPPPPGTAEPPKPDAGKLALRTPLQTMFLGGGAYTFQRYMQDKYPGTDVDVAEIDPSVTEANFRATGLPRDTPIRTTWGDARAFVERNKSKKQYDIIFGDAFNDFSVPWHLTTREFNDMLSQMMSPDGVYMINIIDLYESDATAERKAADRLTASARDAAEAALTLRLKSQGRVPTEADIAAARDSAAVDPAALAKAKEERVRLARSYGGFLSAWVRTARLTFPHVAVYGTDDDPGAGLRETFVVVASKQPLDLDALGGREVDPRFFQSDRLFEPRPYGEADMAALDLRSRKIVLTDDYAPVENLLAKVAATRGDD